MPCIVKSWLYRSGPRKRVLGARELQPHQQRRGGRRAGRRRSRDDVTHADRLVVDGVSQPTAPAASPRSARALARARPRSSRSSRATRRAVAARSSQALQVGRQRLRGRRGSSWFGGILRARLDAPAGRRSSRPGCRACCGSVPAASVRRLPRWVRSGPTRAPAGVPRMAWHITHASSGTPAAPRCAARSSAAAPAGAARSPPALELLPAARRRRGTPFGVLIAAELGALAAVDARPCRPEPESG